MRNVSFSVPSKSTLNWENDWDPRGEQYRKIVRLLSEMMEVTPGLITPSEERVLSEFSEWTVQASGKSLWGDIGNASFVYANFNTGLILVVVACTTEEYYGQMRLNSQWIMD